MEETAEISTVELSNSSIELGTLRDVEVSVNENTSVFVSRMTLMSRGRGQDVIDPYPYRASKDFLHQQAHRRMESSMDNSN